ncbi:hypothetical protein SDC9_109959 [bioreactor metagenome]|uniref:Uncharacterized protein n=1 Tax=bioreactor metagenome TaxID=1076179 RepID=A0A645BC72_9ZZZZ
MRVANGHHGILRVKLPVRVFIRLLHTLDVFHDVECADKVDIQRGCVPDEAEDHLACAKAGVDLNALAEQPVFQAFQLVRIRVWFEYDNHNFLPPPVKKPQPVWLRCDAIVCAIVTRSPLLRQTERSLTEIIAGKAKVAVFCCKLISGHCLLLSLRLSPRFGSYYLRRVPQFASLSLRRVPRYRSPSLRLSP